MSTPIEVTADYAYLRLRDEGYQQADIERWASTVAALPGVTDAFVYFKHEEQGLGPDFAQRFITALRQALGPEAEIPGTSLPAAADPSDSHPQNLTGGPGDKEKSLLKNSS